MRRLVMLVTIILLSLGPASLAADGSLPICTDVEFVDFFDMIVEHQILFESDITNASMLNQVSRRQMERRNGYQSELPQCAEAIAIQRLLVQLGGDALARAALELADLPADDSPYIQRFPDDQTRITSLLSAMLAIDRSKALPSNRRELPACAPKDWSLLDDAATVLLDAYTSTRDEIDPAESLAAIDRLLLWREAYIPTLPECAQSIDLIQAMSAAATDAAAYHAFNYGGVSRERNPFPPLLEAAIATVTLWQEQRPIAAASQSPSAARFPLSNQLLSCADAALGEPLEDLQSQYNDLMVGAGAANFIADMTDFGYAQINFRESRLAQLPMCAEAVALRWWAAEALADASLRSAIKVGAPDSIAHGHDIAMTGNLARASSGWANLDSALGRIDTAPAANAGRRSNESPDTAAPECLDADHVFLLTYLIPKFWKLTDAALKISQPEDVSAFIDHSYTFRRLLWENLPRCDDAIEIGLLMRSVAADAVAMLALELAEAPVRDIPYLPKIARDINRAFEWTDQFVSTCGSLDGSTTTYYVVAENIANIRSCASTSCSITTVAHRGQRLDVVDDLSNWYEIVLPSCETAFIAGFLASQTPPPR